MATGLLTKGAKLMYKKETQYVEITDLQSFPSLGGQADKQEVTTLADAAHRYIKGLIEYGELQFKFLYDNASETSNYRVCKGLDAAGTTEWTVELPDKTTFEFSGESSTAIDEGAVNAPLTFTMTIALNSDIKVTNPA